VHIVEASYDDVSGKADQSSAADISVPDCFPISAWNM
jgi:hypothetical protein